MRKLVTWFQENFPWFVVAMKNSSHHFSHQSLNPYHLEGDVWTHTMMVCKQAEKFDFDVQVAALLHDIGKPDTRSCVEDETGIAGKTRFFGHESASAFLALNVMEHLKLPRWRKEMIFQMIALHTEPYKLEPKKLRERLKGQPDMAKKLLDLATADHEGRFAEQGNFERPNFKVDGININVQNKMCIMMVGLPGSGKSTIVREEFPHHDVLSRDIIVDELGEGDTYSERWKSVDHKLVNKKLQEARTELMRAEKSFVVDMTNMSRKSRRKTLSQLPRTYHKKAIVVLPTLHEIFQRNDQREGKRIDDEVIWKMIKAFYPPLYDEFDSIEWRFE